MRRALTSDAHALRPNPALHLVPDLREPFGRARLVAGHENRLRVRRADQPPSIAEQDADSVHVDHVIAGSEVLHGAVHELELALVTAFDANLGSRAVLWHVAQQLNHGLP